MHHDRLGQDLEKTLPPTSRIGVARTRQCTLDNRMAMQSCKRDPSRLDREDGGQAGTHA